MRPPARLAALLLGLLAAPPALAAATPPGEPAPTGIRGVVLDTTCFGPCSIDDDPEPYAGDRLRLLIRRPADPDFRRRVDLEKGRFLVRLRRGLYRVTAFIPDPCWEGETKTVGVRRGELTRVELHVHNACIV